MVCELGLCDHAMADKPEKIVVMIPAFNEAEHIGSFVAGLNRIKTKRTFPISEIIVVDDGSKDKTAQIAAKNGAKVVRLKRNYGKAFAFFVGARKAKQLKAAVLVTLDADLQPVSPEQLMRLVWPLFQSIDGRAPHMSVGTVQNDWTDLSGQRAIRMKALQPLLSGNKKWEEYFGIRSGKFRYRIGYGLEEALNNCLGYGEQIPIGTAVSKDSYEYQSKRARTAKTLFVTRRGVNTTPFDQMGKEIRRAFSIRIHRDQTANLLRQQRQNSELQIRHLEKIRRQKQTRRRTK